MAASNPHILLTEDILKTAVKTDLGPEWELQDFEIKDFGKLGDNYACAVTGVSCISTCNGVKKNTFYIAKLNPLTQLNYVEEGMPSMFIKEAIFFTDVAIKLNDILQNIGHPKFNIPECVYFNCEKGKESILTKDLRKKGFQMFEKKIGMDIPHSLLVIKELAKVHASSYIFKSGLQDKGVLDLYPFLQDTWLESNSESREQFDYFLKGCLSSLLKPLERMKGYDNQYMWLKNLIGDVMDVYAKLVNDCPEKMKVICHGDCWNNNFLFRYDDEGNVQEIVLLDLQLCKFASLGIDLNYFFYTSLTGKIRKQFSDYFLSVYFENFKEVMGSANMDMPFTEEELRQEVYDRILFGIISSLVFTPLLISENEDAIDFCMVNKDIEEYTQGYGKKVAQMADTNPIFRERLLSILDDVLEKGLAGN